MGSDPPNKILDAVSKRANIIEALASGVDDRGELVSSVSVSRMTVDRALRRLEELKIVTSVGSDYWLTQFGRHVHQRYVDIMRDYENLDQIQDLLEFLPASVILDASAINDANIIRATMSTPQRPQTELLSTLKKSSTVRMVTPVVDRNIIKSMHIRAAEEKTTTLMIDEELSEYLWMEQGKHWKPFVTSSVSNVIQLPDKPPFALMKADRKLLIGFYDNQGILRGIVKNEDDAAVVWAESRLDEILNEGRELMIRSSNSELITAQT